MEGNGESLARPDLGPIDFLADPEIVRLVVRGEHLAHGFLFNPAFTTEISLIDPLPHQRIAVYDCMLVQPRLRMLLADDAGAGKTIMAGIYMQEMLIHKFIRRILIIPPAGLVGNWERELRILFNLRFKIIFGADARGGNPFVGSTSDLVIVSLDTLRRSLFSRLQESTVLPYDLIIFDEAHKLAADRRPNGTVRRTDRYCLAEAMAGIAGIESRWTLPWTANHLLLLTATPHMGKDFPYYCLWRLLEPEIFSTFDAFKACPKDLKKKYFLRRTKEEMVRFDGSRIYPPRVSDTLSYNLSSGDIGEQVLYEKMTNYIRHHYNRARILNRSAARFAMTVFQRRLASSTYATMKSLERRADKLQLIIKQVRAGSIKEQKLTLLQNQLSKVQDIFDAMTPDEEEGGEGQEQNEIVEDKLLGGFTAVSIAELETELNQVNLLVKLAREVYESGVDMKFEKLYEIMTDSRFQQEKILVFTEHRDTLEFLCHRLEGKGFTSKIASIHGGMDYREREVQVDFFRTPVPEGGAQYLIATDAAGEGINLQFCWLMVNYDIPWNPARLEQRMGRVHRYKQQHTVQVLNLVAGKTREGYVLKVLLDKLEKIREQLGSDKVFDVIGRIFEGLNLREYMEKVGLGESAESIASEFEAKVTKESVQELERKEQDLYGKDDVKSHLDAQRRKLEHEKLVNLLPGFVRVFLEKSAPLFNLTIEGNLDSSFSLRPLNPAQFPPFQQLMITYPEKIWNQLSLYKPRDPSETVFLRPGDPFFDAYRGYFHARYSRDALRGGIFVDPYAEAPYFLHMGVVTIIRKGDPNFRTLATEETLENRLFAIKWDEKGTVESLNVEYFFLLRPSLPTIENPRPQHKSLDRSLESARKFAIDKIAREIIKKQKENLGANAANRRQFILQGYDYLEAELAGIRSRLLEQAKSGDAKANAELKSVKDRQQNLSRQKKEILAQLVREPDLVDIGEVSFFAHAMVIPSRDPEDKKRHDKRIEKIAVDYVMNFERTLSNAEIIDVHTPELAVIAGLQEYPGFDLISKRSNGETRNIEVKGRAGIGEVEPSDNEWTKADNLRQDYWLYVVYDCASSEPHLHIVRDPHAKLKVRMKGVVIEAEEIFKAESND